MSFNPLFASDLLRQPDARASIKLGAGRPRPGNTALLYLGERALRSAARHTLEGVVEVPLAPCSWGDPWLSGSPVLDACLRAQQPPLAAGALLPASGLERLYRCLAELNGEYVPALAAAAIATRAAASRCLSSIEAAERYCDIVAWAAADLAVDAEAWAGVHLAGPMARALRCFLELPRFRAALIRRQPALRRLAELPVFLVLQ
ncbi:MAG: glucokinase [Gammaproteobacteria bacterium]